MERNVLDELLGEHSADDDLSDDMHFASSGEFPFTSRQTTRD